MADATRLRGAVWTALGLAFVGVVLWLLLRGDAEEMTAPFPAQAQAVPASHVVRSAPRNRVDWSMPSEEPSSAVEDASPAKKRAPPKAFEVEVIGADGAPAAGATVLLVDPTPMESMAPIVDQGSTGDDGIAQFGLPGRSVRGFAWRGTESGVADDLLAPSDGDKVSIRLGPGVRLSGRIVTNDGTPVVNASVRLDLPDCLEDRHDLSMSGTSDRAGGFDLPAVPVGARARVREMTLSASAVGFVTNWSTFGPEAFSRLVVVEMERTKKMRGRIVDGERKSAADFDVQAPSAARIVRYAEGRFEIELPVTLREPLVAIRWVRRNQAGQADPKYKAVAEQMWVRGRKFGVAAQFSLPVDSADLDIGDVVVPTGLPIDEFVVDRLGRPIEGARVMLMQLHNLLGLLKPASDGRFEFPEVGSDAHVLMADGPLEDGTTVRTQLEDVRGGSRGLRVVLSEAQTLIVRMHWPDGRRAGAVNVRVAPSGQSAAIEGNWSWPQSAMRFGMPRVGTYDVTVEIEGAKTFQRSSVQVTSTEDTAIDVEPEFVDR